MDAATTILIAEDDAAARAFLADNLTADGYRVLTTDGLDETLRGLRDAAPDAVIADLDGATLPLLDRIRAANRARGGPDPDVPLIILSANGDELGRVRALERGCDDHLTKPYSYAELRARLGRLLERAGHRPHRMLRIGPLAVDPAARQASLRGRAVHLSRYEFDLLHKLAGDPARVFTKQQLLRDVWDIDCAVRTRTLDSHACRLRRKLAAHGDRFVIAVWGVGYRLIDPVVHRAGENPLAEAAA